MILYYLSLLECGKVPKWPKGADSKSARRRKPCVGSNPTLSAIHTITKRPMTVVFLLAERGENPRGSSEHKHRQEYIAVGRKAEYEKEYCVLSTASKTFVYMLRT